MPRSLTLLPADQSHLELIMEMEAKGFATHLQESRDVYSKRINCFPQGSLMAFKGLDCVGCLFSEIWNYSVNPKADDFLLNHSIDDRHRVEGTEIYISSMTINPNFRGQGIGRVLFTESLNYFVQHFSQLESAILLANEQWRSARHIYEQSGFQTIMKLENFFGSQATTADGLVMRKYLR
jgi:ribosomal protein S18 acetylase RimI-like enzyme